MLKKENKFLFQKKKAQLKAGVAQKISSPAQFLKTQKSRALLSSWHHDGQDHPDKKSKSSSPPPGNLLIREMSVVMSACVLRQTVRTDSEGGREALGNPAVGRRMPFFEKEVYLSVKA